MQGMAGSQKVTPLQWLMRNLSGLFQAAFVVCLATGAILAFQYRPTGDVLRNVEEISSLIPFGFFFRGLHYASAQFCLVLALAHVLLFFYRGAYRRFPLASWLRLCGGLYVLMGVMLTGFILKGDQEARLACTILENLAGSVPALGPWLAAAVVSDKASLFFLPYVYHCFGLPLVLIWLLRVHVRAWIPDKAIMATALALLAVWSLAVPLPMPAAHAALHKSVNGPWFLWGLQELLRHGSPFVIGVCLPGAFLLAFGLLPVFKGKAVNCARWCVTSGLCAYALLTVWIALR
jgi:hypothetical protein